jgi:hypothetical protein
MTHLEALIKSGHENNLRGVLEELKEEIADVRNGEWTVEERLCAIRFIDQKILDKIIPYRTKTDGTLTIDKYN